MLVSTQLKRLIATSNLNMHPLPIHALILLSLICFACAMPTDLSATVPTSNIAIPTTTAQAFINGTYYRVEIGEKLAVKTAISSSTTIRNPATPSASTSPSSPNGRNSTPANWPANDAYSIDFQSSDFKGSTYCNPSYKSFWIKDWETDHTKRPASCDAVAYNHIGRAGKLGINQMYEGNVIHGPTKDGANVCYWHFTCSEWYKCQKHHNDCGPQPTISYQNLQDV